MLQFDPDVPWLNQFSAGQQQCYWLVSASAYICGESSCIIDVGPPVGQDLCWRRSCQDRESVLAYGNLNQLWREVTLAQIPPGD